jgi:heat shock protein HslJ
MRIPMCNPGRALWRLAAAALLAQSVFGCAHNPKGPPSASSDRQDARTDGSWLDRSPANWNRKTGAVPPPAAGLDAADARTRCPDLARQPNSAAEHALAANGWMLYGEEQVFDATEVITATSGADGMCRPLGYQVFVYWQGRYAGTLSPVAMNSRSDGALSNILLTSPTRISADFLRYRGSDPLCCPSRVNHVTYELARDDLPLVAPIDISTRTADVADQGPRTDDVPVQGPRTGNAPADAVLFGRRWRLIEVGAAPVARAKPYIEFDRDVKVFAADSGCNRIAGSFELDGTNLKFTHPVSMKRPCVDSETRQVEADFLKGLELTTGFQIQGDILRLSAGGTALLTFKADPSARPAQ